MARMTVETPGKVNLVLEVLGRRPDGHHDIQSLMMSVGLYDRLTFESNDTGRIELTCDAAELPTDDRNLVYQAAAALQTRAAPGSGCRIHLEKRIPAAAGMGGGSSDAAATLKAMNRLWSVGLNNAALARIGATLGADIPFFLTPCSAIVSGIGDCVEAVELAWHGWVGLAMTGKHVATNEVYAACRIERDPYRREDLLAIAHLSTADQIQPRLRNGLEEPVFEVASEVKRVQEALKVGAGVELRVSGAGSVLFGLFDDAQDAERFLKRARECDAVRHAIKVAAPGCMRVTEGDNDHGDQRRSGETDWQR